MVTPPVRDQSRVGSRSGRPFPNRPKIAVKQNLLYPKHQSNGAQLLPRDQHQPLLSYGDVPAEYEAATQSAVIFDETDRGQVKVSGADSAAFLNRILSNQVLELEVGEGNRNLLLTGKGKILFDFDLSRVEGGFLLSIGAGQAAALAQGIDMYLFAEDAKITDTSEESAPLLASGPRSEELLAKIFPALPQEDHQFVEAQFAGKTVIITKVAPYGHTAYRIDGGPEQAGELWSALVEANLTPTGRIVSDITRVTACRAVFGEDIDSNVYPQEARLEEAYNLSKGCYIGQEVVAKIDTYGGINKRLCTLRISHSDPLPPGTRLFRWSEEKEEWRDLGVVTSWAYSFEHDTGQVLAYIKRRHQEPGTTFRVDDGPAEATVL
ncbi:MAG: folate-binding protein YgfZ [Planctomycetota bacterium]|jgi:folate-binding protein YgfZ